jgi:hypothetical protein
MTSDNQTEDQYTVVCLGCNAEWIDPSKRPGQKYAKRCQNCGRTNLDNQRLQRSRAKAKLRREVRSEKRWAKLIAPPVG